MPCLVKTTSPLPVQFPYQLQPLDRLRHAGIPISRSLTSGFWYNCSMATS